MKYRYLPGTLSLIIALLGCNLLSSAPSIGEAGSLLTNTPAQPVDAPLPLITPLPTDTLAQPPVPTTSEVQPPASQQPAPQQPQPNPPTGCSGTPNISFTASRTTITVGESTTLSWTVTNSDARQIDNGVGNDVQASDFRNVSPGVGRTTYTLTARCGNNTATKGVTVNVDGVGASVPNAPAAPSKPQGFTAQGIGTKINFSWTGVSGVIYRLYKEGQPTPLEGNIGGTGFSITRDCNFTGKFFVRAVNSGGESPDSDHIEAVTVPCKPTNFTAEGSGATITFRWGDTANETGFFIYSQSGQLGPFQRPANSTSYTLNSQPCNTGDNFYVSAVNSAGESAGSNQFEAVTVPCAPTIGIVSAPSATQLRVEFTDKATNEEGFHIYRVGTDQSLTTDVTVGPLAGTGRPGAGNVNPLPSSPCGLIYRYYVKAYNAAGESEQSFSTGFVGNLNCTVTVTFNSFKVLEDTNLLSDHKKISCDLGMVVRDENGSERNYSQRLWPQGDLSYVDLDPGESRQISLTLVFNGMRRSDSVTVIVDCEDDTRFSKTIGTSKFGPALGSQISGTGEHCATSTGAPHTGDGLYEICFMITLTP